MLLVVNPNITLKIVRSNPDKPWGRYTKSLFDRKKYGIPPDPIRLLRISKLLRIRLLSHIFNLVKN
jgi:hypothetical protein